MKNYKMILEYISYFENIKGHLVEWKSYNIGTRGRTVSYPVYDDKFKGFIDTLYRSDLLNSDYMDYIDKYMGQSNTIVEEIESADFELLRAILTYYVRQEKFCDGVWATAIKEGIFLMILNRFKTIEQLT